MSDDEVRGWEQEADHLAERSLRAGDDTGWFEQLYAAGDAGAITMPWNREVANVLLREWFDDPAHAQIGGRALVVGCGLGADAEFVAGFGFATVAFDVSPTAIEIDRRRHVGSSVDYVVANVLDLPTEWSRAFDLVVEIYTVQALPDHIRNAAIAAVAHGWSRRDAGRDCRSPRAGGVSRAGSAVATHSRGGRQLCK